MTPIEFASATVSVRTNHRSGSRGGGHEVSETELSSAIR
jgi:hypothetical protein